VIALISLSSLIWVGELEEVYKIGHYVEGIRVGVLTTMRQILAPLLYSSVSFSRPSVTFPGFTIFSGLIEFHYI